ncbi:cytochrome c maturation protein CcmE [Solidesulfovibrio magneticus]|uniref:Cytochrome c-type biogenesis protein CcmE n=1 Tax=Solidesulfovibrio magneticus (strain ATCC 700980 / DSM 13731 / RS-1) TaxID=573370 RepID=C4XSQ0_SOLM1|nr:cytochrome c maturation protein CcmE [Solidesulfovibrio magneticus]BAH75742.1 putative cytochrome c-type biogenesis protein CcmE [Solidesulfovibrio magneticus RS-1]
MAKKKNTPMYLVALTLFLGGLGYLLYSGLGENTAYFLNVSEALAMPPKELSKARLFGTVAEEGIDRPADALGVSFTLLDKDQTAKTIRVDFKGVVPDTFKPGVEVIVEGGVNPASGAFAASTLMTKCPSKYQKENRG